MEEITQLNDDVFEQIKDFNHKNLTEEQESLINKLILDEKLKQYYKNYGLCKKCKQLKGGEYWCQMCNTKRFQRDFKNWTSGNNDVDKLIQKRQLEAKRKEGTLEWIEYDRFENIEYLAEGGFGTVYKATWKDGPIEYPKMNKRTKNQWKRQGKIPVALKCLHHSQNIEAEFLKEIELHNTLKQNCITIVRCYGITKDPKTNDFMMVMEYAQYGNLRQHLNNNFNSLDWAKKLEYLFYIANGLSQIHEKGLIHRDFHCGNILGNKDDLGSYSQITDLGLCKQANVTSQSGDKQIYGVLPYVAPEVLKGKEYTQASDVYGFGIIAYELCTGLPPYHDIAHDEFLAIKICNGLRPKSNYKVPQLILDTIQQCWDADPLKRPKANELSSLFEKLFKERQFKILLENVDNEFGEQIKEANKTNRKLPSSNIGTLSYATHAQAVYTSRLLKFKNLPEPRNSDNNETEYSESTRIDFTKLF